MKFSGKLISTELRHKKGKAFIESFDKTFGLKPMSGSSPQETENSMVSMTSPKSTPNPTVETWAGHVLSYLSCCHCPACKLAPTRIGKQDTSMPGTELCSPICGVIPQGASYHFVHVLVAQYGGARNYISDVVSSNLTKHVPAQIHSLCMEKHGAGNFFTEQNSTPHLQYPPCADSNYARTI